MDGSLSAERRRTATVPLLHLLLPDDRNIRGAALLRVADSGAEGGVAIVDFGPKPGC